VFGFGQRGFVQGEWALVTVRDRLADSRLAFTRSELKVIRELWANYPAAGLTTISRLARRAGVSDPTVVRLANKLGFEGFVELQEALLAEVEDHLSYPLAAMVGQRREFGQKDIFQNYMGAAIASLHAMQETVLPADLEAAVALLTDGKLRIRCLGGRFSRSLAAILRVHLQLIRPDTELLEGSDADLADRLVDVGPRDVLVVYDFRRYQANVVRFALEAKAAGAKAILITDRWKSPIAQQADVVFTLPVETVSPFDTMVPGLLLTETLIAAIAGQLSAEMRARMETMERYRSARHITLGSMPGPDLVPAPLDPAKKTRRGKAVAVPDA
jgi:DNA-binding MurR/RpiR family transcriptional regulator